MAMDETTQVIEELLTTSCFRDVVNKVYNPKADNFLTSTFFSNAKTFNTQEVEIDIRNDRANVAAQFTHEHANANIVLPDSYRTLRLEPILLKETYPLDIFEVRHKVQFGETRYDTKDTVSKVASLLKNMTIRLTQRFYTRFECMAADCLFNGSATIKGKAIDAKYSFWNNQDKPYVKVTTSWDKPNATVLADIDAAASRMRAKANVNPNIMIVGPDVKQVLYKNAEIAKLYDIRNFNIGSIQPKYKGNGLVYIGSLGSLDIYSYEKTYCENEEAKPTTFIPKGKVLLGYVDNASNFAGRYFGSVPIDNGNGFTYVKGEINPEIRKISTSAMKGWDLTMFSRPVFCVTQPHAFQVIEAVFGD